MCSIHVDSSRLDIGDRIMEIRIDICRFLDWAESEGVGARQRADISGSLGAGRLRG